jgi:hypothetical protein
MISDRTPSDLDRHAGSSRMVPEDAHRRAPVVDDDTFALITELEIRKAVRLQYYVSLLGVKADLEDRETVPAPRSVTQQLADMISVEVRATDVICVTPATPSLRILLVNAHLYNLPVVIQRIVRTVSRHVFEVDDGLREIALSMGAACFPSTARGRTDLFTQVTALVGEAEQDRSERYRYRIASTEP